MDTRHAPDVRDHRSGSPARAKPAFNFGPESKFFDRCKGRRVRLLWKNKIGELCGKLLWVDRFTIGVVVADGERELMIYKDSLQSIEPLNHPCD